MKETQQQRDEQLSALIDNALNEQQLQSFMQDLKRDSIADGEKAQRYHLIGDAMRDELDQSSFMDISAAVHRSIEQEPGLSETEITTGVETRSKFDLASLIASWVKPLTGMAVAASVAMVTLFTFSAVQNNDSSGQSSQLAQTSQLQTAPAQTASAQLVKVNPEVARNVRVASTLDTSQKSPEQQKQLNSYMLQHSGHASQSTMQGMMPYVRAADVQAQESE